MERGVGGGARETPLQQLHLVDQWGRDRWVGRWVWPVEGVARKRGLELKAIKLFP